MKRKTFKKILSMVLTTALIIGIISGLTVAAGATTHNVVWSTLISHGNAVYTHPTNLNLKAGNTINFHFTIGAMPINLDVGLFNPTTNEFVFMVNTTSTILNRTVMVPKDGTYRVRIIKNTPSNMNLSGTFTVTNDSIMNNRLHSLYYENKFKDPMFDPNAQYLDNPTHAQYRMNCYGYALGNILEGSYAASYAPHRQYPGHFAFNSISVKIITNLKDENTLMSNLINNMQYDAIRLGYTMTEYTTANSTVEQFGLFTNSTTRLIALVTATDASNWHFYMQHSDGTWSHKPGTYAVTNKVFDNTANSTVTNVVLTNANIKANANKGLYAGGQLRFFTVTKHAVWDYPHTPPINVIDPQTTLVHSDIAGECLVTARNVSTGATAARIDFHDDQDFFRFQAPTSKTYSISTTGASSGSSLGLKLYSNTGLEIKNIVSSNGSNVSTTQLMIAGQVYYIEIYSSTKTQTNYTLNIS